MSGISGAGGRSESQFHFWGAAQSLVTTTALMGLSVVAIRAIERYSHKTFNPLLKQGLGLLATGVYFTASTYIFPWHQPINSPPPLEKEPDPGDTQQTREKEISEEDLPSSQTPAQPPVSPPAVIDLLEDGFVSMLDPAKADPTMVVGPARYNEKIHGLHGSLMRERMFETLMLEYIRILKELGLDPKGKLTELGGNRYKSAQQTKLMDILNYLVTPGSESSSWWSYSGYKGHEGRYLLLMDLHRKLINDYSGKEELYDKDAVAYGRALSEAWMRPEMQSFQESLVSLHFSAPPRMTSQNVHQAFSIRNEAVRNADPRMKMSTLNSTYAKVSGGISLCNYFEKNPPNLRKIEIWSDGNRTRRIYYLRHSTPTQGTYLQTSIIDPIYRDFLRGVEKRGQKGQGVLYAVHQRLGDYGCKAEQEGYRAQAIVDLEKDHPNLLVLFQSVENDLFMSQIQSAAYLKEQLINSFQQKSGKKRNRLPGCLMQGDQIHPDYRKEMEDIFDFVHGLFFDKKDFNVDPIDCYGGITKKTEMTWDSQTFILLFYHFQREHLKHADLTKYGYQYEVTFVNTGCKDDFDRGFGQNMTTDRVHQTLIHGQNIPHEDLEAMVSSGQAPPIQTKGIPVIRYRIQPALQVSRRLAMLSPEKIKKLQEKSWNGFRLQGYDVRRHPEQSAVKKPAG